MNNLFLFIFLFFAINLYGQNYLTPSEKQSFGLNNHTNRDISYFSNIDNNQNIISVGTTERDSTFTDVLTTKLDSNLNLVWQKRFSFGTDLSYDTPLNTFIDDNNDVYVVFRSASSESSSNGILIVVKYDTNGNELWSVNVDAYDSPQTSDFFYQNSFLDENNNLRVVYVKVNDTGTTSKFFFYTINSNGLLIDSFSREDVIDSFNSNFTGINYKVFYSNNNYYVRYRRNNNTNTNSFYEHFIKKITSTTIDVYSLNSLINISNTWSFNRGVIELDSVGNIYLLYPLVSDEKIAVVKLDSNGNLIYDIGTPSGYDKTLLDHKILANGNLCVLSNSKVTNSSSQYSLNKLEYDSLGNIIADISTININVDGLKYYSDNLILVYFNGSFELLDGNLSSLSQFSTVHNELNDFNLLDNNNIIIGKTSKSPMYLGSDFTTEQDIIIEKINLTQIVGSYAYSGEGTSKAFGQKILLDASNNSIVATEEKLGPDNWSIGGSRAPIQNKLYKYDTNLNLLWDLNINNNILNVNSTLNNNIIIDSNGDIYINSMINSNTYELIKVSSNGAIVYQVPSYQCEEVFIDMNGNINVVSPIFNTGSTLDDIRVYTFDGTTGNLLSNQLIIGHIFLGSFKNQLNDTYLYLYSGDNRPGRPTPKIQVYKNLVFDFEFTLAITGTFGGMDRYKIDDEGSLIFSSSWGQLNEKLHQIKLTNSYNHISVANKIINILDIDDKILTLNNDGYLHIYNQSLNLLTTSTVTYSDQPRLFSFNSNILLNTSFDNSVTVLDDNLVELDNFLLPDLVTPSTAQIDSSGNLLLTGQQGYQIALNHEYSWSRGFIHKYSLSTLSITNDLQEIDNKIKLFPNPAKNYINVEHTYRDIKRVKIFNKDGRLLLESKESIIDVSEFPSGLYFLRVELDEGDFVIEKFLKE